MTIAPSRIMTLSCAHSCQSSRDTAIPAPTRSATAGTGGIMRLHMGIENDVDLDAPSVGAHQRSRQPGRIQKIGLYQNGLLSVSDDLDDRVSRPAIGTEIDHPRRLP
jgi:hypothetical protein